MREALQALSLRALCAQCTRLALRLTTLTSHLYSKRPAKMSHATAEAYHRYLRHAVN